MKLEPLSAIVNKTPILGAWTALGVVLTPTSNPVASAVAAAGFAAVVEYTWNRHEHSHETKLQVIGGNAIVGLVAGLWHVL